MILSHTDIIAEGKVAIVQIKVAGVTLSWKCTKNNVQHQYFCQQKLFTKEAKDIILGQGGTSFSFCLYTVVENT